MLAFAIGVLATGASASATGVHEDGNALSLLQTSSLKVSEHSSGGECKAAKAAHKAARAKVKTDKSAIKAARQALKAAREALKAAKATKVASDEAAGEAYNKVLEVCPIPEVDLTSPDEGCSATVVTSYRPQNRNGPDLLDPAWCAAASTSGLGFDTCLPGGGVPEGHGKAYGDKLGIAIMQPCSVAWTNGGYIAPKGTLNQGPGKDGIRQGSGEVMWKAKAGMKTQCECLEWAKSVAPWPESIAVTFQNTGNCQVHKMTTLSWKEGGPALYLSTAHNNFFTCYLGNPAEWQQRYDSEKAQNQLIDKCSKPEWSPTMLYAAEPPSVPTGTPFKSLWTGSGHGGAVISTKECYQVAKDDPACANAVALSYKAAMSWCRCIFQSSSLAPNNDNRGVQPQAEVVCMF